MIREEWVEFDLDGVLCKEKETINCSDDYRDCEPIHFGIILLKGFKAKGFKIRINTSRYEVDEEVTKEWLKNHDVQYDELLLGKPPAVLRIDDRSLNPANNEADIRKIFTGILWENG